MFDERTIHTVVAAVTDKATADQIIAELRKPVPEPFNVGQVVTHTRSNRLYRWGEGMSPEGVRALNQSEVGDGFTVV